MGCADTAEVPLELGFNEDGLGAQNGEEGILGMNMLADSGVNRWDDAGNRRFQFDRWQPPTEINASWAR
jgi:hypothetical protein